MPLDSPSPSPSPSRLEEARSQSIGYLALAYAGQRRPLQICRSAAGYYLGTLDDDGAPFSRESAGYFPSQGMARQALASGQWQQRLCP
ncbi:MAG: hypothetical protein LBS49_09785 [Candidatus Accumulibacter sp.]|jgi:hypothetical protein|nr:hypothetical protein [Accumulibacter sp.]